MSFSERDDRILLLGGGGHARVLWSIIQKWEAQVVGFTDPTGGSKGIGGLRHLGGDDVVRTFEPSSILLINGLGSVSRPTARRRLFDSFRGHGYAFLSVIHPDAIVDELVTLGSGVQVFAGAVLQPGVEIGANAIVNTRASVDHDCLIGRHVHVAPGVTLSGDVRVGEETHIGVGATVVQGVRIGAKAVVGAGAVVLRDVPAGTTVVGVPARPVPNASRVSTDSAGPI